MDIKILEEMLCRKEDSFVISVNEFYYDSNDISNCVYETSVDLKVYSRYDERYTDGYDTFDLRNINYTLYLSGSSHDILNYINSSTHVSVYNDDLYIHIRRDYICGDNGEVTRMIH